MSDRIQWNLEKRFKKYKTKHIDRSITLFQVYVKNHGRCADCGCSTTYGVHPQVSNSATMEHVIPLSHGGNHVWSNVELLCYSCNMDRNKAKAKKIEKMTEIERDTQKYKRVFSVFGYTIYMTKDKQ